MNSVHDCIESLKKCSGKKGKFSKLEKKINDRFGVKFNIVIGQIGEIQLGFDNHHNHPRPHIHTQSKDTGRNSFAIDTGEILHKTPKRLPNRKIDEIKEWILNRKDCLKLIYENIQKIRSKNDFEELIDAMNRYISP